MQIIKREGLCRFWLLADWAWVFSVVQWPTGRVDAGAGTVDDDELKCRTQRSRRKYTRRLQRISWIW